MPELPEVEVVCKGLSSLIIGDEIENAQVRCNRLRLPVDPMLEHIVVGKKIIAIKRRAKYILIYLSSDIILIIHLGMTGNLIVHQSQRSNYKKHDHVIFHLKSKRELAYQDIRKFGLIEICPTDQLNNNKFFKNNGPEPLGKYFNAKYLYNELNSRTISIKQALMNNDIVVGVGNIYACEILFKSHISPFRKSSNITLKEADLLVKNTKEVLKEAIIAGGSSFSDYINASGEKGYFQHNFQVYKRENQSCYNCFYPISRIKQQGRSSFFCLNCQE